ncbi:MAG TPA: VWA-like domain-containing protein [Lachnospiraceae bacterium]|nr:VWA-like domain-containing protein [Lachnospiraceae bacterium]
MESYFDIQVEELRRQVKKFRTSYSMVSKKAEKLIVTIPEEFKVEFFSLVDKVNFSLLEDNDNFFGYFLFQMGRDIRFDISSPTGVNFIGTKYIIYFNPLIFLTLNRKQMESTIKHEILHIVSMHLIRAKALKGSYSKLAINMAMDIVVNRYLDNLPPGATTLELVNERYSLNLQPSASFEYYVEKLQSLMGLQKDTIKDRRKNEDLQGKEEALQDNQEVLKYEEETPINEEILQDYKGENQQVQKFIKEYETEIQRKNNNELAQKVSFVSTYDIAKTHDIWEESSDLDEKTWREFTAKVIQNSEKGTIPTYLRNMIEATRNRGGELPWNLYLNRLMGTVESNRKRTITRRNRRQPERLDLKGELRSHKANIVVAIDISGSISDEEFKQAMVEVLSIVKNYNHEITILECDDRIRSEYKVKSVKDIRDRTSSSGATKFNPVFEYANKSKINLLIYFTDGKGEDRLKVIPRGYKVLWIISGSGEELSLKVSYGAEKRLKDSGKKERIVDLGDVARGGFSMNNQESIL